MILSEKQKLDEFISLRNKYISMLEEEKITKSEFNHLNNKIFEKISLRPFTVLNSFNEALYNYNYYNSKAKICLEEEKYYKSKKDSKSLKKAKLCENNKLNYYFHKDKSILFMIEDINPSEIEAYFITMHSKSLNNSIFEINFLNKDRVILHTKNEKIKTILEEKNIFKTDIRESLISSYINN